MMKVTQYEVLPRQGTRRARVSGNLLGGGSEWISLADNIEAVFTVDSTPSLQWAAEAGMTVDNVTVIWQLVRYDQDGVRTESEPLQISVSLGEPTPVFIIPTIAFSPRTLNLQSHGKVVTAYIELPEGHDVNEISISSIKLNHTVPALANPTEIGDYDGDGTPDLMVKFSRAGVDSLLTPGARAEVTVTGEVAGIAFEGGDTIRVISRQLWQRLPWRVI
jgi:hypothetical protein